MLRHSWQHVPTGLLKGSFEFVLEACAGLEFQQSIPHLLQLTW